MTLEMSYQKTDDVSSNHQTGGLPCLFLYLVSGLCCNFFIWLFCLLLFPFCKFPLPFLTLIEGKNVGENAPRYDLNFPLRN